MRIYNPIISKLNNKGGIVGRILVFADVTLHLVVGDANQLREWDQ